ncbi:MAG: response regulator, partial [Methanobacteriota archaeon]
FDVTPEWQRDQKICLHFQVKDTGIGVPPEKQDKIFNSFEQADGSFSRSFSGTGLGLAISARLVEMMDGSIWVESPVNPKPGNGEGPGSVFHFLAVFEVPLPIVEEAPIPSLQDLPLLLISDDPTNTNVMLAVLNSWGIKTTHLTHLDSRQRKDFSADWHFKWILVDLLPLNENTHQVLEQIKHLATETRTPVIFASSMENPQNLPMLVGYDGLLTVIQKPIQIDSLKQLLQNLLNQEVKTVEEYPVEENTDECGSYKILLAEDNHVNQKLAQKMLEKLGHQVVVANNGKMALEKLQGEPFDLVIMDIQMPEMDGFEATARIREEEKTSGEHLPIIALTANAMSGDRERCLEAGMDDYLAKPIKKKDLIEVIRKVMRDRVNA